MTNELVSRSKKSSATGKKSGARSRRSSAGGKKFGARSKKFVGMKKVWPPLKDCAQYKYGMINCYLKKRHWESLEIKDEIQYYSSEDEGIFKSKAAAKAGIPESEKCYNPCEIKKFLEQVRNSQGYDVDILMPDPVNSPFWPVDVHTTINADYYAEGMRIMKKMLMKHIKSKTGKVYKYGDTLKLVHAQPHRSYLLTFTAREDTADAPLETFLATVFLPRLYPGKVVECFLKPDGPAPTEEEV